MTRLPKIGEENWGEVLNEYLLTAHSADGTIKPINASQVIGLQKMLASKASVADVAEKYTKPKNGIPLNDLHPSVQAAVAGATTTSLPDQAVIMPSAARARLANVTDGASDVTIDGDASATQKGILKLTGDLGGTADIPTVPALATKVATSEKAAKYGVAALNGDTRIMPQLESRSVQVGIHFPGYADSTGVNTSLPSLQTIETDLKFKADYVLLFQAVNPGGTYTTTQWNDVVDMLNNNTSVVLNFELLGNLAQINNGEFNTAIDQVGGFVLQYAKEHPEWKNKLLVKFMHEGNLTSTYPWCVYANTNLSINSNSVTQSAAQYVKGYRSVATRLRQASTADTFCYVRTIWEIGRDHNAGAQDQYDIFYPGDDVVDICSINNYNRFGIASGYSYYNTFGTSFKPAYEQLKRIAPQKPIMVGEASSTPGGEIVRINVTNGGSGYSSDTTVIIEGDGINAAATAQVSGGKITGLTMANVGQDYTNATIKLTGIGSGAVLAADIRGGKFSKAQWFLEVFEYVRDATDVLFLTFFFENKNVDVTDNRQWAPNTPAEKTAWVRGYHLLNRRVKEGSSEPRRQVIRKNLCPDPRTLSLSLWRATGTNVGLLTLNINPDNFPDHSLDATSVLQLTHNGVAARAETNRFYFTLPYTQLAPNQNITISFDARSRSSAPDAGKYMFVQPGIEMVDSPNTFERNYPPFRVTNQYQRYTITVNNGQYSPSGWRICWRIGTSTMNGAFQMTNVKVEYGEHASPLAPEEKVVDATHDKKGILKLNGDLAGTSAYPTVPTKIDRVRFGAWHTSVSLPTTTDSIQQAQNLEKKIGNSIDMLVRYGKVYSTSFATDVKPILDAGYDAQFFLEPTNGETDANLDTIISSLEDKIGAFYNNFYFFFKDLAADGRSEHVVLCMFHEANGDGFYPWQAFYGTNSPEKLKHAYQLTVSLARSLGVLSKFAQIYITRNSGKNYAPFSELYAGDEYIDLVGVTDYNRQGISYNSWRYPGMLLKSAYRQLTVMSRRPVMIAESNCVPSHDNFSRSQWFRQYKDLILSDEYSRIWSYTIFSEDKTSTGDPNWFLSSDDMAAVADLVESFKHRPEIKYNRTIRQPNKNLLSTQITASLSGWNSFGEPDTPALSISELVPDWFDPSERSLKVSKTASTSAAPKDINVYYLPSNYSFWQANKTYTLSFWAKSSRPDTRLGIGVREHGNTFQIYADYSFTIDDAWNFYTASFATDIPYNSGVRLPWFALGQNDDELDIYLTGLKLEYGHQPTLRLSSATYGLDKVDNTSDKDKPISTSVQMALDNKVPINGKVSQPINFEAEKNINIVAVRNNADAGHNISSMVFESRTTSSREIQTGLETDAIKRFSIETSGRMEWGRGEDVTRDTALYRQGPKMLRTDGGFTAGWLRITNDAGAGKVLVSDDKGYATWKSSLKTAPITKKAASYTLTTNDYTIIVDATNEPCTMTLPPAQTAPGLLYVVKKIDSSTNVVSIVSNGQKINSGNDYMLASQDAIVRFQSDGTQWWTI